MVFYPPLDEKNLKIVGQLYADNKNFFDNPECPYSKETIELFKGGSKAADFDNLENVEALSDDEIEREVTNLWRELKDQSNEMRTSENSSDKNTYFRMATALLEKLINLREKIMNQKKMHEFTAAVLRVLEEELDKDSRNRVLEELGKLLEEK